MAAAAASTAGHGGEEQQSDLVLGALGSFNLLPAPGAGTVTGSGGGCGYTLAAIEGRDPENGHAVLVMTPDGSASGSESVRVPVPCGSLVGYVDKAAILGSLLPEQQATLGAMLMDHAVGTTSGLSAVIRLSFRDAYPNRRAM